MSILTPKGIAVYPHLNTPDTKFDADGAYKVTLRLTADEGAEFVAQIDALCEKSVAKAKEETGKAKVKVANPPYEIDEDTGDYLIKFKSKAAGTSRRTGEKWSRVVPLVDGNLNPCPSAKVGGGSEIIIATDPFLYYVGAVGAGVSLRIDAVQIVTLQEWGNSVESMGFEKVGGFTATDAQSSAFVVQDDEADDDEDQDF